MATKDRNSDRKHEPEGLAPGMCWVEAKGITERSSLIIVYEGIQQQKMVRQFVAEMPDKDLQDAVNVFDGCDFIPVDVPRGK